MELVPGQLINERYRLETELGTGGFGAVWRAVQLGVEREVAIKFLRTDLALKAAQRFDREAKLLGRLNHPGCVMLHDFGTTVDGRPYLVTEYVHGETLQSWANRDHSMEELLEIARQLSSALAHAHRHQIVHRDLKPANVLITRGDDGETRVKVLDFGVARVAGDHWPNITKTGVVIGTPGYMAPEQLLGGELTDRTDLYALGVLLFELVEGRAPFEAESKRKLAMRHIKEDAPPLTRGPQALRDLVARLLARNPLDRPLSSRHLYDELCAIDPGADGVVAGSRLREDATTVVGSSRGVEDANSADMTLPYDGRKAPTTRVTWRPNLTRVALAAIGLVAGAGFVLSWMLMTTDDEPEKLEEPEARIVTALNSAPRAASSKEAAADVGRTTNVAVADRSTVVPPNGTAGCGGKEPSRGFTTISAIDGLEESKLAVYVPEGYDRNVPHRWVVMLHDTLQTPEGLLEMTQFGERADEDNVVLILAHDESIRETWRSRESGEVVQHAVDLAREQLCLRADDGRMFAFGAGGSRLDDDACSMDGLRSVATSGHRLRVRESICEDVPIDYLVLHNLRGFDPPEGGKDCLGGQRRSIEEHEGLLAERNRCEERERVATDRSSTCFEWRGCERPLIACEVDGGRPWRGEPRLPCLGEPADFPYADMVWKFFFDRESMYDNFESAPDTE